MDYRDVIRLIFWPWLIISCIILIRRAINRTGSSKASSGTPDESGPTGSSGSSIAPPPTGSDAPPSGSARSDPVRPVEPGLPTGGAAGSPPQGSVFDPPEPRAHTARRTIAEMVQGVRMPCDLAPIVDFDRRPSARDSVAFSTTSDPPTEVGLAVGEELRRLGYELHPQGETGARAVRGQDALEIAVHPEAGAVSRGTRPAFAAVDEHAVVVELWTE